MNFWIDLWVLAMAVVWMASREIEFRRERRRARLAKFVAELKYPAKPYAATPKAEPNIGTGVVMSARVATSNMLTVDTVKAQSIIGPALANYVSKDMLEAYLINYPTRDQVAKALEDVLVANLKDYPNRYEVEAIIKRATQMVYPTKGNVITASVNCLPTWSVSNNIFSHSVTPNIGPASVTAEIGWGIDTTWTNDTIKGAV